MVGHKQDTGATVTYSMSGVTQQGMWSALRAKLLYPTLPYQSLGNQKDSKVVSGKKESSVWAEHGRQESSQKLLLRVAAAEIPRAQLHQEELPSASVHVQLKPAGDCKYQCCLAPRQPGKQPSPARLCITYSHQRAFPAVTPVKTWRLHV